MSVDEAVEKQEAEAGEVMETFMTALDVDEDIAAFWLRKALPRSKKLPTSRWKK